MTGEGALARLGGAVRGFGFKQWFLLALNVVLAAAAVTALVLFRVVGSASNATTAAQRFQGESDTPFSQLAVFMPVGQGKSEEDILAFRHGLENTFVEQSLQPPENGKLYLDAYSASGQVSVSSDLGSASAAAIGVGGDFFYFHPLTLRSGSYISQADLMDDLVVLDEEMAWRLFGGIDLAGMELMINGVPFVVSGVVSREDDFATRRAYSGEAGLFMSYAALCRLLKDTTIDCYEIVMPNPISDYAKNLLAEQGTFASNEIVENSTRYQLSHLWQVTGDFGERSMRVNGVIYPYWENALRLSEDYAALLLILAVLFALCPLAFLAVFLIRGITGGWRRVKKAVPVKVEAAVEKHKEARFARNEKKKTGGE